MKRAGGLWAGVLTRDNLLRAFRQAARGKRGKWEVRRFEEDLDRQLDQLRAEVVAGSFEVGRCHVFKVFEPKERLIHAARFVERVFHHALMNVCEPVFERQAVFHSYACRVGKGRLKAMGAAERAARAGGWFLKLDIRRYFESIPQDRLFGQVQRIIKDPMVLNWFGRIIASHAGPGGQGLPIGSLTSQHLANFYLNGLDRHCQAQAGVSGYVRYMDDFVLWSQEKVALVAAGRNIQLFVEGGLGLRLKHPPSPQRTALGMDFLGYRIYRTHTTLARRSKVRYRRKVRRLVAWEAAGAIAEGGLQARYTALTAFCRPVCSWRFRRGVLAEFRSAAIGYESGEPGRQLEQRGQQRPLGEPEQQQPGQPEQQHRLPPGPQLSPVEPIGTSPRWTEPAAVRTVGAGQRQTTAPSRGAGRVSGLWLTRTPHATPGGAPAAEAARSWGGNLI